MQVLASGQAGVFATLTGSGYIVERIDSGETREASPRELSYFFAGCNDVASATLPNIAEARKWAEMAWNADRAVRLFIILLDPQEPGDDFIEVGLALEELLETPKVVELVENQIFSAPIPEPFEISAVREALEGTPVTKALFERFIEFQLPIMQVRQAFESLDQSLFGSVSEKIAFRERAIDGGSFRALVLASITPQGINSALFQAYSSLTGLENHREIIQQWTAGFERFHQEFDYEPETEEHYDETDVSPASGGRQAYENALQQQLAIADRIRAAEFDVARKFARELVQEQTRSSSAEHIAKSLSSISQKAKHLDVLDLALEWAQQAVETKPDDPKAHAQLADILMKAGRYTEAHQSLDLAQSFGEVAFAISGRARILRHKGQYEEALEAFRESHSNPESSNQEHYDLAGIAECLRDLERFEEALNAYEIAITKFPFEAVLHSGRAATLVDLSCYEEALESYQTALQLDDFNVVPRTGIASLYRRAGAFEAAEAQYRDTIADYPFNVHARGGFVAMLRDLGRFDEAVTEAENLAKGAPASPDAMWILADAQIDARDFEGATKTLEAAHNGHRHIAGLQTGLARVEKSKGNYKKALALYDQAARDFPGNLWIQVGRADLLRRLGSTDEALRIYEASLARHPHRMHLKNALASLYIHTGRYEEASDLLNVNDPKNSDEWRNFAIRGMLEIAVQNVNVARRRMEWGIERCQFPRELNILRATLARIELHEGHLERAVEVSKECVGDYTELVRFHASATLTDKSNAKALYEKLLESYLPEPYHELRDEIAANCNVIDRVPQRDVEWIFSKEQNALLLEAA